MPTYKLQSPAVVQSVFRYSASAGTVAATEPRIDTFLGCADWSLGVAKILCQDCQYSYFRPFSCKVFHLCPSCDQKRTLLYAEYLAQELLLLLPHRQFVFTIPKILRPILQNNKGLFGAVSGLIFKLISKFFSLAAGRKLECACVVSYQSFGEFAHFHPHWHVLVLEGGFDKFDRFVYLPMGSDDGLLKVWSQAILSFFKTQNLIDDQRCKLIQSWKHSGFSVESDTRMLSVQEREALGQYVVRGSVAQERISFDIAKDRVTWQAPEKGYFKGQVQNFTGAEFAARLLHHLPPRRVQLVRRYGIFSSRVRSKWSAWPGITRFAPPGRLKAQGEKVALQASESGTEIADVPDTWTRLRRQSWARLLHKIYEVDPYRCPNCGGQMEIVAVIQDPVELKKITAWASRQVRGPPV